MQPTPKNQGASPDPKPASSPSTPAPAQFAPSQPSYPAFKDSPFYKVKRFLKKHHRKLWWLHSTYALGLGISVVVLAQKGFEHARILAITLGLAWLIVLLLFRVFGSARRRADARHRRHEGEGPLLRDDLLLKNLYQGMLFFLLPFYWKSTTLDSPNVWFVLLLGRARSSPRWTSSSTRSSCASAGWPPSSTG